MNQIRQATILVVDDEGANCRLLEALLAAKGHAVRTAASGEEALQVVAAQLPDLILLDIMMPGIDGFEVTRRLKADSSSRHIPIVLVTSLTDRESLLKGLEVGANEFISKPVNHAELLTRVNNLLKVKEFNDFLADHNRMLEEQVAERTAALQESEERYRKIVQNSMDGFWVADTEGRILEVNDAYCKMIRYAREELLDMRISDVEAMENPEVTAQHMQKIMTHGNDRFETRHRRKDGQLLDLEVSVDYYPNKESGRFSVFIRDITESKRMELKLRESEARYRRITEGITDYLYTVRIENGRAVEATHSPACVTVTGYVAEEFAADPQLWIQMVVPEDRERVTKHVRQILAGNDVPPIEHRITRKNGETHWISDTAILFRDASGQLLSYDGVIKDITARKQAEAKIQHVNRALAALGVVNRTLVHATDENELLQAICDAVVEQKGYQMAWVGYKQHNENKSIKIMARAGHDEGYLDNIKLTWEETKFGMEPSGSAIRSGATQLCQDIDNDPHYSPWREAALKRGYAASIGLPLLNLDGTVFGILNVYAGEANAFAPNEIDLLEEMAGDLAFGVRTLHTRHERDLAMEQNRQHLEKLHKSLEDTVQTIASMLEMRDPYTAGHQRRVADLAAAIAVEMGLPEEKVRGIHLAGTIHDLGKIQTPAEILSKPGRLSASEFGLIKDHPQNGYEILKNIDFPWPIALMVLQHHERLDGLGYPQGLKGETILIEARILAVADVVEAMSSHRPYRPGLGIEAALVEITKQRGTHYDPQVVDACLAVFRDQHYSFKS